MSKLKVPDISSGDLLDVDEWNEHFFNQIRDDARIGSENIAEEGINKGKVRIGAIHTLSDARFNIHSGSKEFGTPSRTVSSVAGFTTPAHFPTNHVPNSRISYGSKFFNDGSQFIVRAAAEVHIRDYGSRTFFAGVPPTAVLSLFVTTDASPSSLSDWRYCQGTKQVFSLAFSSKIASDSGGSFWMNETMKEFDEDCDAVIGRSITKRPDLITISPHSGGIPSGTDSWDTTTNPYMLLDARFSYSTTFLLNFVDLQAYGLADAIASDGSVDQVSFCLGGGYSLPAWLSDTHPSAGEEVGYPFDSYSRGCGQVEYEPIIIRNTTMSLIKMRE